LSPTLISSCSNSAHTCQQKVTATKPSGDQTVYTFTLNWPTVSAFGGSPGAAWNTTAQSYSGAATGTPLVTVQNDLPMGTCMNPARPLSTTVTIPTPSGNIVKQSTFLYPSTLVASSCWVISSTLNLQEMKEFAFGLGSVGGLARRTVFSYLTGSSYTDKNILDRKTSELTYDGANNIVAQTQYEYDNYTSPNTILTSGAVQHDSAYGTSYTTRGNVTRTKLWRNTDGAWLTTVNQYDDAGSIVKITDPLNHFTQIGYADSWSNANCAPSNAAAYPTSATDALNHVTHYTYNSCTGSLASTTDPNNQPTTITYDSRERTVRVLQPDNGRTWADYTSATVQDIYSALTQPPSSGCSGCRHDQVSFDSWGRVSLNTLVNDPDGQTYVKTDYDSSGRVNRVSNPYRGSDSGGEVYGYDGINRVTSVTRADNSVARTYYDTAVSSNGGAGSQLCNTGLGHPTLSVDEAGKKRQTWTDAFGRIVEVDEPDASNNLTVPTCYQYDPLDNLISVVQNSSRQRTFTYNSVSELTTATNPESGTITYTYNDDGLLIKKIAPAPNQTGSATVTTCFGNWNGTSCDGAGYDAVHRLVQKSYSDGTPSASFTYDASSIDGFSSSNPIGRLVKAATGDGLTRTWNSYDSIGRIANQAQCSPLNCGGTPYSKAFAYDFLGNHTSETYSYITGTIAISYGYNGVGRTTQITSNYVDLQHPATLVSGISYTPAGAISQLTYGNSVAETRGYNTRLQPTQMRTYDPSTGTEILNITYGFNLGTSDNGNVVSWSSAGQRNFNRSFTYDQLNRLLTLNQSSGDVTSCTSAFSLSWTYDAWGNRTDQNVTGGTCNAFHATVNVLNRLVGPPYQYDSAGNLTYDGSHSYTYDAENRVTQVDGGSTASYVYDAGGRRVRKTSGGTTTDYLYDLSDEIFATFVPGCTAGCWTAAAIYLNGRFVAEYFNSTTYFVHPDHLGTTRILTALDKSAYDNMDFLPFGEQIAGDTGTVLKFTGKERDSESGLDNFGARYNSSSFGRFMTPDPDNAGARLEAPQSWNAYSYVLNNPLKYVDPFGLDCIYLNDTGDAVDRILPGDCESETDNGYYVDSVPGTVTTADISFTRDGNGMLVSFRSEDRPGAQFQDFCTGDCSDYEVVVHAPAPPPPTSEAQSGNYDPFEPQFFRFHYTPPQTVLGKIGLGIACAAGTDPNNVGPLPPIPLNEAARRMGTPPADSGDSTAETEGQKGVVGPGKNGKPRLYTPNGTRSAANVVKAADRLKYVQQAFDCYGNGTSSQ